MKCILILAILQCCPRGAAYSGRWSLAIKRETTKKERSLLPLSLSSLPDRDDESLNSGPVKQIVSRRSALLAGASVILLPSIARAFPRLPALPTVNIGVETGGSSGPLIQYKDPLGLFALALPKGWFKIRPTAEGDLPDFKGRGRRGSRIFSSGEISNPYAPKVLSVERFPVRVLLEDAGVTGDIDENMLQTWPSVGKGETLAAIIINRRDAESIANGKSMLTRLVPGSVSMSDSTLTFRATTEVPVTRPEILEEQTGRREIRRISYFRGELRPGETVASAAPKPTQGEELAAAKPTSIITALWTSIAEADLEDLSGFEDTIEAIQDSFEVF